MSELTSRDRRQAGLVFLLGDGPHVLDYQISAVFKAHIDALMQILPLWVEGIARHAAEVDKDLREHVDVLMRQSGGPWPLIGGD